jgi:hypothetical protein
LHKRNALDRTFARLLLTAGLLMLLAVGAGRFHHASQSGLPAERLSPLLHGRHGIVLVFQPHDCSGHRSFVDALNALHRSGRVPVAGIPLNAPRNREELKAALLGFDPAFPLAPELADHAGKLLLEMGFRRTPVALVVDPGGRPLMVVPPHPVPYREAELIRLATEYLENLRAGAVPP